MTATKRIWKTYEAIGRTRLRTPISVGDKTRTVLFDGSDRTKARMGRFRTSNKEIQQALEESANYGKKWRLVAMQRDTENGTEDINMKKYLADPEAFEVEVDDIAETKDDPPEAVKDEGNDDLGTAAKPEDEGIDAPPEDKSLTADEEMNPERVAQGVLNAQQAKKYLTENFEELTFRDVRNKEEVLKVAREKNVRFPDWETQ